MALLKGIEEESYLGAVTKIDGEDHINTPMGWQNLHGRDIRRSIFTHTGLLFWPLEPHVDDVSHIDVAHGLSNECRFGGQSEYHYSVAWHSVALSYVVPVEYAKSALIHDAPEAYLKDIPRPMKNSPEFSQYEVIENRLMETIAQAIYPEYVMDATLYKADSMMGSTELLELFNFGEGKLIALGYDQNHIDEARQWRSWVREVSPREAKESWLRRYIALFHPALCITNNSCQ